MYKRLMNLERMIGGSPLVQLDFQENTRLFAKLEFLNLTGSIKIWPAYYILMKAIKNNEITESTTVIESSSGNFGIALAMICKHLKLKFIPVIDPNINHYYEQQLKVLSHRVEKVEQLDETGGYLLTRLNKVHQLLDETENAFWPNQYGNPNSYLGHYHGVGKELVNADMQFDFAFISVSSGGTITGISRRLKERFPNIKIIAVDLEGSVIFGDTPKKRSIPGIGSSIIPPILKDALIDEVILVSEDETIEGCHRLLEEHGIFSGGSSGSAYSSISKYFANTAYNNKTNVVFICPDYGGPYMNSVYSQQRNLIRK